jgi:hypothetical protein
LFKKFFFASRATFTVDILWLERLFPKFFEFTTRDLSIKTRAIALVARGTNLLDIEHQCIAVAIYMHITHELIVFRNFSFEPKFAP